VIQSNRGDTNDDMERGGGHTGGVVKGGKDEDGGGWGRPYSF
jgi:hypothetical protein